MNRAASRTAVLASRALVAAFALLCLASCKPEDRKPEEVALQTAKVYYDYLLQGDYNSFVEGTLQGDTVPADYRQQLLLNMQMFVEKQRREHQGIVRIEPLRAVADTATHTASAFLSVHYADSVREEIVVPMVEKGGIWYLR